MKRTLMLALAAGLLIAADAKDDAREELKKWQGSWTTTAEYNGEKSPDKFITSIKDDKFTVKLGDKIIDSGTFKLGVDKKLKTIDATSDFGPNKGNILLGIYEMDGDTIKVCFAEKERPKEFSAKKDSGQVLNTMTKEKK
jgi:uncharacterized protein (TIGR03067 family)